MDSVDLILDEIYTDDTKLISLTADLGRSVSSGKVTLLTVVEALGPKLTHTEAIERCRAVNILNGIFSSIDEDKLSEKELTVVIDFLHDRLRDQHLIIPKVIHCISHVIRSKNLPNGGARKLLVQLFQEANIQSHIHKDRKAFFLILSFVLENKIEEIAGLGSDFIMHFIQAVDGEKDPRNLLIIFDCIPTVLNNFPLGPFIEEFFEVFACYFPVDFTPVPTNDEPLITRENLADALNVCLSHTNTFAPYLVPLILEKLESNVVSSKVDSLKLLGACCQRSYSPEDLESFLPSIWRIIKHEVFMGASEAVNTEIFQLMKTAFLMLSRSQRILNKVMDMVFDDCKHHLTEPELRLMQPASGFLIAAAESSELAFRYYMVLLLPLLNEQFLTKTSAMERRNILFFINKLVALNIKFPSVKLEKEVPKWDEIVTIMYSLLSHAEEAYIHLALEFFVLILPNLDTQSVEIFQQHLLSLLASQSEATRQNELTMKSIFRCLHLVANLFPLEVKATTVGTLLKEAESINQSPEEINLNRVNLILRALVECCCVAEIASVVIPFVIDTICTLCEATILDLKKFTLILAYLKCLRDICRQEDGHDNTVTSKTNSKPLVLAAALNSVSDIVVVTVKLRYYTEKDSNVSSEVEHILKEIYLVANEAIRELVRSAEINKQRTILQSIYPGDSMIDEKSLPGLVLEAVIGSLRTGVCIDHRSQLLAELLISSLQAPVTYSSTSLIDNYFNEVDHHAKIRLFANLANKTGEKDNLIRLEKQVVLLVEQLLGANIAINLHADPGEQVGSGKSDETIFQNGDGRVDYNCFARILLCFIKALVMRGTESADSWIAACMELLKHSEAGSAIANNMNLLVADCDCSLNLKSHCIYRFLYKQRIFLASVPILVNSYKQSQPNDAIRNNYIIALSNQLLHVPKPVLRMELDNVLPLLIACLANSSSSVAVRVTCLKALKDLLSDCGSAATGTNSKDSVVLEYFHDIIPHLVAMSSFRDNMDVRILALECLQKCAKVPSHMLIQEKQMVVESLKQVVGDPKRFVRKQAVVTRNVWILSGAPGGL